MDGQHPFDLPQDFPFAELGQDYATGNFSIQEIATRYDISRDTFLAIRRAAPQTWTQEPPNLWWEDLDKGADEIAREAADRAKAADATRQAKRRKSREDDKAARKWHSFEENAKQACQMWQEEEYEAPQLQVTVSQSLDKKACGVLNLQDLHLGVRPVGADGFSVEEYRKGILSRLETALEDALRLRYVDELYLIGGGDLVHSDGKGRTASGTELEMACSTTAAIQHGIQLLVEAVDMGRQAAENVTIVPVHGNHDRTNGVSAALAAAQRYHDTKDVSSFGVAERQYATYNDRHLFCMTHGDMAKKRMRNFGEIMRAEYRQAFGYTQHTSVFTGHLHHKAMDMIDESGRTMYQTPSPVPLDAYHNQEGYVGSRKGIQLVLLEADSGGDRIIHA